MNSVRGLMKSDSVQATAHAVRTEFSETSKCISGTPKSSVPEFVVFVFLSHRISEREREILTDAFPHALKQFKHLVYPNLRGGKPRKRGSNFAWKNFTRAAPQYRIRQDRRLLIEPSARPETGHALAELFDRQAGMQIDWLKIANGLQATIYNSQVTKL